MLELFLLDQLTCFLTNFLVPKFQAGVEKKLKNQEIKPWLLLLLVGVSNFQESFVLRVSIITWLEKVVPQQLPTPSKMMLSILLTLKNTKMVNGFLTMARMFKWNFIVLIHLFD